MTYKIQEIVIDIENDKDYKNGRYNGFAILKHLSSFNYKDNRHIKVLVNANIDLSYLF